MIHEIISHYRINYGTVKKLSLFSFKICMLCLLKHPQLAAIPTKQVQVSRGNTCIHIDNNVTNFKYYIFVFIAIT